MWPTDLGQLRIIPGSHPGMGMAVWCTEPLNKPPIILSNFINQNNVQQGPLFSFTEKNNKVLGNVTQKGTEQESSQEQARLERKGQIKRHRPVSQRAGSWDCHLV